MMSRDRLKRKAADTTSWIIKVLVGLVFVSPLILGMFFSFQPDVELDAFPLKLIADNPTLDNYIQVFNRIPLFGYLKNTLIVCIGTIVAQVIFCTLAAYAFTYFNFPGKNLFFTLIISAMAIPGEVVIITNYITIQKFGWVDTYAAMIVPSMVSGTAIFMMRQYFMSLPRDFKEAATIDGCGDMRFLFQVAMPLAIPTISALAIYLFVNVYNKFFWPLLVTNSDSMRTVQIGISFLITGESVSVGRTLAGAFLAIIPSVIIYVFGQDYIIKGMTAGGVKG